MGNHTVRYLTTTDPEQHWARCRCGWGSDKHLSKQSAEDEVYAHERHVEKVRAYLYTATPTLKQSRDYYRAMAEDPNTPEQDRGLWEQMARELDHRVNDGPHEPHPALYSSVTEL